MAEFRYRRRRLLSGGVLLAAIGLAAGLVGAAEPEPETVSLVRDYFEAVRERDVDRALSLARVERPAEERGRFLVPEAMDGDWEILAVRERPGSATEVEVVLEGKDGRRHGTNVRVVEDGGPRIEDPLVKVRFGMPPVTYLEVGRVRIPFKRAEDRSTEYVLLPGFYRLYQADRSRVRAEGQTVFLSDSSLVDVPELRVTPAAERAVARAYRAHIDRCVAAGGGERCPFGTSRLGGARTRNAHVFDPEDVRWTVREYPTVAVFAGGSGLTIVDRDRGVVELSGTGRRQGEPRGRFTVRCETRSDGLQATVHADGRVSIIARGSRSDSGADPERPDTCRDGWASFE